MQYVLYSQDYDNFNELGTYEGPDGLDVCKLKDKFMSNFDYRGLGKPDYPKYNGPTIPLHYGPCSSGSLPEGTPMCVMTSPEFIKWDFVKKQSEKDWSKKRDDKVKEFKIKYKGKTEFDMFLSYLKVEFGFKEVKSVWINVDKTGSY